MDGQQSTPSESEIPSESLIAENSSLKAANDLLVEELASSNKLCDKLIKQEIKKLTTENDRLRKEASKLNGMRRFTQTVTQTPPAPVPTSGNPIPVIIGVHTPKPNPSGVPVSKQPPPTRPSVSVNNHSTGISYQPQPPSYGSRLF